MKKINLHRDIDSRKHMSNNQTQQTLDKVIYKDTVKDAIANETPEINEEIDIDKEAKKPNKRKAARNEETA